MLWQTCYPIAKEYATYLTGHKLLHKERVVVDIVGDDTYAVTRNKKEYTVVKCAAPLVAHLARENRRKGIC